MTFPTIYSTGTVSVANGGTTVTGVGTAWLGTIYAGDLFTDPVQGIFARVTADAVSNTSLSINAWPGTSLSGDAYEILITSDIVRMQERTRQVLNLLTSVTNTGIGIDAFGLVADRTDHDTARAGFAYLAIDGDAVSITDPVVFLKNTATSADWSDPVEIRGTGPTGATGLVGTWLGAYAGGTAYVAGDVVENDGSTWIAIASTTGNAPPTLPTTSNTWWELLVEKGDTGAAGTNGTNGTNGVDGIDGIMASVVAGTGIDVDATDPANPVVSVETNLQEWNGVNPSDNGKSLVAAADYAAMKALLDLEAGTDFLSPSAVTAAIAAAGGKLVAVFTPLANQPPTSNFATLDTRNGRAVLDFDTTTQETAIFSGVIPSNYGTSGLTVIIEAALTSATSGSLGWDAAFEKVTGQDIDSDSFATALVGTAATVPGTSGVPMRHTITFTNSEIDGLAAGDAFRLRIRRDVSNDTAAGDAELIAVKLEIT